jgi:hypothetical protein
MSCRLLKGSGELRLMIFRFSGSVTCQPVQEAGPARPPWSGTWKRPSKSD